MKIPIKEISVGWAETVSLSGYCNVRPSIGYTAIVEEGESPAQIQETLLTIVKSVVRQQIDEALERDNQIPKYYEGLRFQVLYSDECKAVIVVSNDTNNWPDTFVHRWGIPRGMRLETAQKKAQKLANAFGYVLYDCADGNFSKLPPIGVDEDAIPF